MPQRVVGALSGYSARQIKRFEAAGGGPRAHAALIGASWTVYTLGRGPHPDVIPGLVPAELAALEAWYKSLRR